MIANSNRKFGAVSFDGAFPNDASTTIVSKPAGQQAWERFKATSAADAYEASTTGQRKWEQFKYDSALKAENERKTMADIDYFDSGSLSSLGIGNIDFNALRQMAYDGKITVNNPGVGKRLTVSWAPGWDAVRYRQEPYAAMTNQRPVKPVGTATSIQQTNAFGNPSQYAVGYPVQSQQPGLLEAKMDNATFDSIFAAKTGDAETLQNRLKFFDVAEQKELDGKYFTYRQDPEFDKYVKQGEGADLKKEFSTQWDNIKNDIGYMDKSERDMFYYLLGKYGSNEALSYRLQINDRISNREGKALAENAKDSLLRKLDIAIASGFTENVQGFTQNFFSDDIVPENSWQYANAYTSPELKGAEKVIYGIANQMANMAPMVLTTTIASAMGVPAPIVGLLGSTQIGLSARGNAYASALEEGYDKPRAELYATGVGLSEALFQYLLGGISKAGGIAADDLLTKVAAWDNALFRFAGTVAIKGGAEAIEENLQNFFEPLLRTMIFEEEYDVPTWEEILYTSLISFVTANLMESTETADITAHGAGSNVSKSESAKEMAQRLINASIEKVTGKKSTQNAQNAAESVSAKKGVVAQESPANVTTGAGASSTGVNSQSARDEALAATIRQGQENLARAEAEKKSDELTPQQKSFFDSFFGREKTVSKSDTAKKSQNMSAVELRQQIETKYAAGQITEEEYDAALDALMEQESLEGVNTLDRYNPEMMKAEVNDNVRGSVSDDSSQRYESASAGKQTGELAEGTGRDQSGQVQSQRARDRADHVARIHGDQGQQPVTARSYLGSKYAEDSGQIYDVPQSVIDGDTELSEIAADIRSRGLVPHLFTGEARLVNGSTADAMIRGNDVYIRVDSPTWTATQNWEHEKFHGILGKSREMIRDLWQQMKKKMPKEKLWAICERYREAYHGIIDVDADGNPITGEDLTFAVAEEILADAYAGKDTFAQDVKQFSDIANDAASQIEENGSEIRGPPESKNSIETMPDGKKYVRADRQVIFGNDPEGWSEQLEGYINGKIRRGEDVKLIADDGDELVLTARTAGKIASLYKDGARMSDVEYERHVNAGAHIDELVQVSKRGDGITADEDGRHGADAEDGWNYRTAFFQDFDGQYYRCKISVQMGTDGNVVYNIGQMRKRSSLAVHDSTSGSSAKGGAQREKASLSKSVPQVKLSVKNDESFSANKETGQIERVDSSGRELSKDQMEYFRDSKAVDQTGHLLELYHQTNNDFTVFDPRHEGAGSTDTRTPFGIFLKSSRADIGLKGKKQMPLYANITNPLIANTREDLIRHLRILSPEYDDLVQQHAALDREYSAKHEAAGKAWNDFVVEWRKANPEASRKALYEVPEFIELFEAEDFVVDEWTDKANALSVQEKETLTNALRSHNYDGIILKFDAGSWGRSTDAYIALDANQVKSVDNINPTKDPDIRFSAGGVDAEATTETEQEPINALPKKAQRILETEERKLTNLLANALRIPYKSRGEQLDGIARAITTEFLQTGSVSEKTVEDLFEKAYRPQEQKLAEEHGIFIEEYRDQMEQDFKAQVNNLVAQLRLANRYAADQTADGSGEATAIPTLEDLPKLYADMKAARRAADKAVARNLMTESDNLKVNRLLRGDIDESMLNPLSDNVAGILEVYQAKAEYEKFARQIRRWNVQRKAELYALADKLLETAGEWKDKTVGLLYSRETMERNIRDIVKDKKVAEEIINTLFKPIHDAAAAANKMKNQYRDRVRALKLSRKAASSNTISEAAAVQLLGEAEDNIRYLQTNKFIKERDGKSLEDWQGIVQDLWENNPNLDAAKIRNAVNEFRKIYDELFEQMNDSRMRNGYEPVNYRKGYFPHFQSDSGDGILGQFGRSLGINTAALQLPTTINGMTHTFKPGIQWFGSAQQRKGVNTSFDAVEGFDSYIEGVADVIHQTDNIQRLRAFATQVRYRTSDEGLRKQIDKVRNDPTIAEEDKQNRIKEIFENGKFELGNFAVELDEYTNLLAGKKSRHDRDMEQKLGRRMYAIMKAVESRVAANMVAVNPGSWLTNFIPITQGWATLDSRSLLAGMWDTLRAHKNDDGMVAMSSFLTNRRGSDPIVRTWAQGASDVLSKPMSFIDSFTADSLVRARYNQNIRRGMSEDTAIADADAWAAGVMADRSKGATPTIFAQTNPITKLFTQFQLEVNNQLSYTFKDVPREMRERGTAALAMAMLKFMIGAFLYDELYEYFIGRRPALDPLGIINDTVGDLTGYELPNLVELGVGAFTGDMPSFEVEKKGVYDAGVNLATAVAEELPFVGGLLGGGRVPINSALPDVGKLWQAATDDSWAGEKRLNTAAKELAKPAAYILLPFGGGQVKKAVEGGTAVYRGGSYSVDSTGEDVLQYPIANDTFGQAGLNAISAMLFGKSSLPAAREWVESGFDSLTAKQTALFDALRNGGASTEDAYGLIRDVEDADTNLEKISEVANSYLDEWMKELSMSNVMSESQYAKYMDARRAGVSSSAYYKFLSKIDTLKNARGSKSVSQEDVKTALEESGLSDAQKRAIWNSYGWKTDSPW